LLELSPNKLEDISRSTQQRLIKAQAIKLAKRPIKRQGILFNNLQLLKQQLELNSTEIDILLFTSFISSDQEYSEAYLYFDRLTDRKLFHFLANTLDIPYDKISKALSANKLLHKSGLLSLTSIPCGIEDKFSHLDGFFDKLEKPYTNKKQCFS
jgi:hypothetical protein